MVGLTTPPAQFAHIGPGINEFDPLILPTFVQVVVMLAPLAAQDSSSTLPAGFTIAGRRDMSFTKTGAGAGGDRAEGSCSIALRAWRM